MRIFIALIAGFLASCAPSERATDKIVTIRITTGEGDIVAELYPDKAPITTANFLAYVDGGLFEGATIYRATRPDNDPMIEVIQGGLWRPWLEGQSDFEFEPPLAAIAHETTELSGLSHTDGALSMARLAPGTAASEFFISIGDNTELDFGGARNPDGQGFAAFGRVVDGMDIVRAIQSRSTGASVSGPIMSGQILDEPVEILSVARE